jgi:hypothetical protein
VRGSSTNVNFNTTGFFVGFYPLPVDFHPDNGFQIAPLGFDTIVTFMTVFKAFYVRRRNGGPSSRLIQTFLREGVFYYLLISIANLVCLPLRLCCLR